MSPSIRTRSRSGPALFLNGLFTIKAHNFFRDLGHYASIMAERFDRREQLDKVICDFLDRGGPVDGLDVSLSRHGAVDLDLLVDCLNEMKHRMSRAALDGVQAQEPLVRRDDDAPIKIFA
jgi:hypothetical protein